MSDLEHYIDPAVFEHRMFLSERAMLDAVLKVCDTYPDNRNPTIGQSCVYDDGMGHHCLIGQTLVDNGLSLPQTNNTIGFLCHKAGLAGGAGGVAALAQSVADSPAEPIVEGSVEWTPRRWGDVAEELRERHGRSPS